MRSLDPVMAPAMNRRRLALLGILWLGLLLPLAAHETARAPRLLVQPALGVAVERLHALHRQTGCQVVRIHGALGGVTVLAAPPGTPIAPLAQLYQASGLVRFAEPDSPLYPRRDPDDPAYVQGTQWHLHNTGQDGGLPDADIDAPEGWDLIRDAPDIVVAVVDSGVRLTHEDLAENLWIHPGETPGNGLDDDGNGYVDDLHGIDALEQTGDPTDDLGHGTQVAGLIGAVGNNQRGGSGVAWRVRLMPLRFMDAHGSGSVSDAVACLEYALLHGADIVNCSWGGARASVALETALQQLCGAGVIIVAAAGNEGRDLDLEPEYPASYSLDLLVVTTATTRTDTLADAANYGSRTVHVGAPGVDLYSTLHTGNHAYGFVQGSSMAAPVVSGILAVLKARYPADPPSRLVQRLLATSDRLPALSGRCVSGGRVNLHRAVSEAWEDTPLRLTVRPEPGGLFSLLLAGEPGSTWTLEHATGLGSWSALSTHELPADGNAILGPWPPTGASAFFRAQQVVVSRFRQEDTPRRGHPAIRTQPDRDHRAHR